MFARHTNSLFGATLALRPCRLPGVPDEARCGTLKVFENRDTKRGRRIELAVAVLPALGPDRLPEPVALFDGGPGEASLEAASVETLDVSCVTAIRAVPFVLQAPQ